MVCLLQRFIGNNYYLNLKVKSPVKSTVTNCTLNCMRKDKKAVFTTCELNMYTTKNKALEYGKTNEDEIVLNPVHRSRRVFM